LVRASCEYLPEYWRPERIGWSFNRLPESDDTAMTLLALGRASYDTDGCACSPTSAKGNSRYWSTSATGPSASTCTSSKRWTRSRRGIAPACGEKILGYVLGARHHGTFWTDKWHVLPYYPTSRALMILCSHVPEGMDATVE
jgi:hypothetical protein